MDTQQLTVHCPTREVGTTWAEYLLTEEGEHRQHLHDKLVLLLSHMGQDIKIDTEGEVPLVCAPDTQGASYGAREAATKYALMHHLLEKGAYGHVMARMSPAHEFVKGA